MIMPSPLRSPSARRSADGDGFAAPAAPAPTASDRAHSSRSRAWLRRSGRLLVGTLLVVQAAFVAYLSWSYGRTTLSGDVAAWSRFSAKGWVPGDTPGNTAMALHVGVAVLVLIAGGIQLSARVRRRAPRVHRWSGRLYLAGSLVGAISGLWLVWVRGTVGDLSQHVAITINAVLLVVCAAMTWRTARARDVGEHRAWAIRTFVTANGVLFFRMFLALWLLVWRAPVGFDAATFSGPFLTALAFTVYVAGPLAVFEGYQRAQRSESHAVHVGVAAALCVVTLLCLTGGASAVLVLWIPRFH